ncbi:MAG: MBL fold metallo-hydrolase [Bacillota bacterium]
MLKKSKIFNLKQKVIILLFVISFFLFLFNSDFVNASQLTTHFIDVDQGDATLIELPNQEIMLIDGGKKSQENNLINYLDKFDIEKIDYLIGTHPHADHIGGLASVINNYKIGNIYLPEVMHTSKTYENLLLTIKDKGKKIKRASSDLKIIDNDNLKIEIFSPQEKEYSNLNNYSIVLKIDFEQSSFLFTGDIEKEVERELINSDYDLNSDLFKVSHHGSDSSSSYEFIEKISPKFAVISVGKDNSYGHPSSEVINSLQSIGAQVYRTDNEGTIVATSDGKEIKINKEAQSLKKQLQKEEQIFIQKLDCEEELLVLKNNRDKNVDLSNWKIISVVGNQEFIFPENTIIKFDEIIKIKSGRYAKKGSNTLIWSKAYIWNDDGDKAELYNNKGALIDSTK